MFINTEELMVAFFQPFSPGNVAVQMPTIPSLPFVLVDRCAGGDDRVRDLAIADVHVFHSSRDLANAAAWKLHSWVQQWTPKVGVVLPSTGHLVFIDRIETILGPFWSDYGDENLKRYTMRYQVTSRLTSSR
jgi:hypothetical protein